MPKIDCVHHLFRNLRKKLYNLKTSTKDFGNCTQKDIVTKMDKIVGGIKASTNYWIQSTVDFNTKILNLEHDIKNAPLHVFGQHHKCAKYFCNKQTEVDNIAQKLKSNGILDKILNILARIISNAKNLLLNENSNIAEQFNSIAAKFIGGKRINFSLSQSYSCRINAAVVQHNSGAVSTKFRAETDQKMENNIITIIEKKRLERKIKNRDVPKKWKLKVKTEADQHYGTDTCQQEDITGQALELLKNNFLEPLIERHNNRAFVERDTVGQAKNHKWFDARTGLLTASWFGQICNARSEKSYANIVQSILYKNVDNVRAIKHGKMYEQYAVAKFEAEKNCIVKENGLFIDDKYFSLGATPDGLVGDDAILEVKCPYSCFKKDIKLSIMNGEITFWKKERKSKKKTTQKILGVNTNHKWYYQVQGQLHITNRSICYFMIWLGDEKNQFQIEIIHRDANFWKYKMEKKLLEFYNNYLLLEYVDPRHSRNMEMR